MLQSCRGSIFKVGQDKEELNEGWGLRSRNNRTLLAILWLFLPTLDPKGY